MITGYTQKVIIKQWSLELASYICAYIYIYISVHVYTTLLCPSAFEISICTTYVIPHVSQRKREKNCIVQTASTLLLREPIWDLDEQVDEAL